MPWVTGPANCLAGFGGAPWWGRAGPVRHLGIGDGAQGGGGGGHSEQGRAVVVPGPGHYVYSFQGAG